jgi:hypothetical protein
MNDAQLSLPAPLLFLLRLSSNKPGFSFAMRNRSAADDVMTGIPL